MSTSSFLAAAAELLLLFVIARTDFYNYNLAIHYSTLISLISLLIIHWIWILIQLMCPLHLFWPPQRSCCYYYCLWSPGPIFIIIIWLFSLSTLISLISLLIIHWIWILIQLMCPLHLFWPPQRSCCYYYCLWSPGPIFIIIIWLCIHSLSHLSHLSHLSFNFHWIWILIQLMCPLHLFWPPQRSCCYYYCLWSPGPIFIIIIWLFISLLSSLSSLF